MTVIEKRKAATRKATHYMVSHHMSFDWDTLEELENFFFRMM